jgi:hypothetical protein
MKRVGLSLLAVLALALIVCGNALAQVPPGDNSYYFVAYYSNNVSSAPDATLRLINDGDQGTTLYAGIFVFDDSQELQECGYCPVTADGLLSEDVKTELTSNTLTGRIPSRGVIKVLSLEFIDVGGGEGYGAVTGLRGWATHIQRASPTSGSYTTTEAAIADSNLSDSEFSGLITLCSYAQTLGSGQGVISCTPEDHDF